MAELPLRGTLPPERLDRARAMLPELVMRGAEGLANKLGTALSMWEKAASLPGQATQNAMINLLSPATGGTATPSEFGQLYRESPLGQVHQAAKQGRGMLMGGAFMGPGRAMGKIEAGTGRLNQLLAEKQAAQSVDDQARHLLAGNYGALQTRRGEVMPAPAADMPEEAAAIMSGNYAPSWARPLAGPPQSVEPRARQMLTGGQAGLPPTDFLNTPMEQLLQMHPSDVQELMYASRPPAGREALSPEYMQREAALLGELRHAAAQRMESVVAPHQGRLPQLEARGAVRGNFGMEQNAHTGEWQIVEYDDVGNPIGAENFGMDPALAQEWLRVFRGEQPMGGELPDVPAGQLRDPRYTAGQPSPSMGRGQHREEFNRVWPQLEARGLRPGERVDYIEDDNGRWLLYTMDSEGGAMHEIASVSNEALAEDLANQMFGRFWQEHAPPRASRGVTDYSYDMAPGASLPRGPASGTPMSEIPEESLDIDQVITEAEDFLRSLGQRRRR